MGSSSSPLHRRPELLRLGEVEVQASFLSCRVHKAKACSLVLPVRPDNFDVALDAYRAAGFAGSYSGLRVSGLRDLGFLAEFPDMLYLELLDDPVDPRQLEPLRNLRGLSVTFPTGGIDFAWFPQLETFYGKWHRGHCNLAKLEELRMLQLGSYDSAHGDLSELAGITRLDRLLLGAPKIRSLDGVETLQDLRILEVVLASKLESLQALAGGHAGLREIWMQKCKRIDGYTPLAGVEHMRRLRLSDCAAMPDLRWTAGMHHLDFLSFVGTEVGDGDLSPLLALPRLRYVGCDSKRRYSHSFEKINELLEAQRAEAD